MLSFGCKPYQVTSTKPDIYVQNANRDNKTWKVVWEDRFDSPQLDNSKWTKIPPGKADWNDQMTNKDERCFDWKDGKLHLIGIKNTDSQ